MTEKSPELLNPFLSMVLGLLHIFPLCCITSFVLAEVGIALENLTRIHFDQFQRLESDYYDEGRKMHLCMFHARLVENMQSYTYETRPWYQMLIFLLGSDD